MGACVRLCVVLAVLPALASYPARDSVPAQSFSQQQARAHGQVERLALAQQLLLDADLEDGERWNEG